MPIPIVIIVTLFISNWVVRFFIRKNPSNQQLKKLSYLISIAMVLYTIFYFVLLY